MTRDEVFAELAFKLPKQVKPLGLTQATKSTSVFQGILDKKVGKVSDDTFELDTVYPSGFLKEPKATRTEGVLSDKFI